LTPSPAAPPARALAVCEDDWATTTSPTTASAAAASAAAAAVDGGEGAAAAAAAATPTAAAAAAEVGVWSSTLQGGPSQTPIDIFKVFQPTAIGTSASLLLVHKKIDQVISFVTLDPEVQEKRHPDREFAKIEFVSIIVGDGEAMVKKVSNDPRKADLVDELATALSKGKVLAVFCQRGRSR
jgi:hypothetical protein